MRVLPVLDLKEGLVVRGRAGRRETYRPIVSRLAASAQPLDVACGFRNHYGLTELYLADLDAIAGAAPCWPAYAELRAAGFRLWVDAGIREPAAAVELAEAGIEKIIVGLETVAGPAVLEHIVRELGGERTVFSLDLREGVPLGDHSRWQAPDAWSIARQAVGAGIRCLLLLDLAHVGVGRGTGTEALCSCLAAAYPDVELAVGGGVRDVSDLQHLQKCGARTVLVASALHEGLLDPEDVSWLGSA